MIDTVWMHGVVGEIPVYHHVGINLGIAIIILLWAFGTTLAIIKLCQIRKEEKGIIKEYKTGDTVSFSGEDMQGKTWNAIGEVFDGGPSPFRYGVPRSWVRTLKSDSNHPKKGETYFIPNIELKPYPKGEK